MKKLLACSFIFLLSGCVPSLFSKEKQTVPAERLTDTLACQSDEDCVLVNSECCGCNNGGKSIAVHKSQQEAHNSILKNQCSSRHILCKTVYLCGNIQAKCENLKCVVRQK